nr:hypothetical protein SYMBAF_20218 [Serratia symbiotica]
MTIHVNENSLCIKVHIAINLSLRRENQDIIPVIYFLLHLEAF